jgi:hypothetical protein
LLCGDSLLRGFIDMVSLFLSWQVQRQLGISLSMRRTGRRLWQAVQNWTWYSREGFVPRKSLKSVRLLQSTCTRETLCWNL